MAALLGAAFCLSVGCCWYAWPRWVGWVPGPCLEILGLGPRDGHASAGRRLRLLAQDLEQCIDRFDEVCGFGREPGHPWTSVAS